MQELVPVCMYILELLQYRCRNWYVCISRSSYRCRNWYVMYVYQGDSAIAASQRGLVSCRPIYYLKNYCEPISLQWSFEPLRIILRVRTKILQPANLSLRPLSPLCNYLRGGVLEGMDLREGVVRGSGRLLAVQDAYHCIMRSALQDSHHCIQQHPPKLVFRHML